MSKQNVYDNEQFFNGYKKIRDGEDNANDLFEIPALLSLLPCLKDKRVLDLGCGFGEHCKLFVEMGAKKVVGIDISEKMLEVAKRQNKDEKITYKLMPIEDISSLNEKFDLVVSSLAFHYVKDFDAVVKEVYNLLEKGGAFVFSQEHPLVTCHTGQDRWTRNEQGEKVYLNLYDYGKEGERQVEWIVGGVKIYHRTFSTIVNCLSRVGFKIEGMIEPTPSEEQLKKYPKYSDLFLKPDFLLIKASK